VDRGRGRDKIIGGRTQGKGGTKERRKEGEETEKISMGE